ncbi:hypothetical protein HON22_04740 [Candidatus Peregrinibacteria bacterium]|nr:hypothetical protein [Candidatus Peregrinibacteria bacterium]
MYPILFHIYGFEFYTYPIVIFIGILVSSYVFIRLCFSKKLMIDFFSDYLWLFAGSSFVFARIGGILETPYAYTLEPIKILNVLDGGYNFYAGILGFLVSFLLVSSLKKENFWKWMDTLSLSFLLFTLFLFIAEFLAGKNYGLPSDLPWAIVFNIPEVRYTIPIHPVQLYKLLLVSALLLFLYVHAKKRLYDGVISSYALFGFFLIQAVLSFFHGSLEMLFFDLRLSFLLSALASLLFLVILVYRTHPNMHFFHLE